MMTRHFLHAGAAIAYFIAAGPALGQATEQGASDEFGDIVVTARMREERLQDIPLAVTAFSEQMIADRKVDDATDFLSAAPNVSINLTQNSGTSFVTVRGVSQVRNGESPIAVVVDGVQQVTYLQLTQDLFDLESIEVLRGPQGALYGRNAIGGAIVINTRKPSETFEGSVTLGYGRGEDYRVRGSVSGPLVGDSLRFRLAASYRDLGGYYRNIHLDRKVDNVKDINVRGQLFAQITPELTADFKAQYGRTSGGAFNFQYQSANYDPARPCFLDAANPFGGPAPDVNRVQRFYCATNLGYNQRQVTQASLRLAYDAGFATITNVSAYDLVKVYSEGDQFPYTASVNIFGTDGTQTQYEHWKALSNELRITSASDQAFRWMAGVYYLDTRKFISTTTGFDNLQGIVDVRRKPQFGNPANPTLSFFADDNHNRAWAAFGNISYDVTDKLELSVAGRFDKDLRRQTVQPEQTGSLPPGCSAATIAQCVKRASFSLFQPKISARYKLSDSFNIFGSWGIGFRSGQFNASGVAAAAAAAGINGVSDVVGREKVETFELGFKSELFDRRLTFNGTVYTTKDENPLYFLFVGQINAQALVNIDRVRMTGLELEAQAKLADGLEAFANYGYTHGRIRKYTLNPAFVGNWAPYVPSDTWAAGIQYRSQITDSIGLFTRADVEHHGKQYWDADNSTARNGYEIVKLRLGLEGPDRRWSLTGSVENLFDKRYNSEYVLGGFAYVGLPRIWSLDLSVKF